MTPEQQVNLLMNTIVDLAKHIQDNPEERGKVFQEFREARQWCDDQGKPELGNFIISCKDFLGLVKIVEPESVPQGETIN